MKPSTWEKSQSTALDPGERRNGGEGNRSGKDWMGGRRGERRGREQEWIRLDGREERGEKGKGTGVEKIGCEGGERRGTEVEKRRWQGGGGEGKGTGGGREGDRSGEVGMGGEGGGSR